MPIVPPRPMPICQQVGAAELGPSSDELEPPGFQGTGPVVTIHAVALNISVEDISA